MINETLFTGTGAALLLSGYVWLKLRAEVRKRKNLLKVLKVMGDRLSKAEGSIAALPPVEQMGGVTDQLLKDKLAEVFERANIISADMIIVKDNHARLEAIVSLLKKHGSYGRALGIAIPEKMEG